MSVMIPGSVVNTQQGDLAAPTADLLRQLNLQSPDGVESGLSLIKAEALSLTKWIAGLVGAGGALAGVVSGYAAWSVDPGNQALKVALVIAAALVVAVTIFIVGWVTVTDVKARAQTQQVRYEARGKVVHDFFGLVGKADMPVSPAAVEVHVDGSTT